MVKKTQKHETIVVIVDHYPNKFLPVNKTRLYSLAQRHNYQVEFYAIADFEEKISSPTQMGVFDK